MTAPRIAGDVVLRPLHPGDAEAVTAYAASPGFFDHIPVPARLRTDYTLADALDFIAEAEEAWRAGWPTWGIDDGRLVGTIRIAPVDWHAAGAVGYGLHPARRGKGLATAALHQVLAWCRREGRPLPAARCDPDHRASQAVLRRCGFTPVGRDVWSPPGV